MEQQRASEVDQEASPRVEPQAPPKATPHQTPDDIIHLMGKDTTLDGDDLVPLPPPYEDWKDTPIPTLSEEQRGRFEVGPDGESALQIPKPAIHASMSVAGILPRRLLCILLVRGSGRGQARVQGSGRHHADVVSKKAQQ